ncbi:MAG: NUDIX domain-containing protein [Bacteroidia bacterium]|nr:NUDIX domain-containing protein [Bacteroidia bacterium]
MIEAAGGKVFSPEGLVLVIKRFGNWDLPKGKIEIGEMPNEAAVREVREETGLNEVVIIEKLTPIYHLYQNYHEQNSWVIKKTHWFKMFAPTPNQLVPQIIESIEEAKWVSINELSKLSTYKSLEKLFKIEVI